MHISNKAYRDFLLHDERALLNEDGTFNETGMIAGMMAGLYEKKDGPEQVRKIVEHYENKQQ